MGRLLRYLASMLPFPLGWRAALYRASGMRVGSLTTIDRNLQVTRADLITIGSRVTIANAVSILADVTAVNSRLEEAYGIRKSSAVVIEDDAYIGAKATILPGVRVGRMATVAANTLVAADVPPYGVVIGVPGRVMMVRRPPSVEDGAGRGSRQAAGSREADAPT